MSSKNDYQLNTDSQLEHDEVSNSLFNRIKKVGLTVVQFLRANLKVALPIVLILATAIGVHYFLTNQPGAPARRPNLTPPLTVSVQDIVSKEYQVNVQSYGNITPRTQSFLVAQVSGVVTHVGENLRTGSFFEKGEILLKIDDRDYLADISINQQSLAEAKQALSEELASAKQAQDDWNRLGNTEPANDLVLRKPQLQAAQARVTSAKAALSKAELALERTHLVAPFSGRVLSKMIDLGQATNSNAQIAEVYATDYLEVRLPIRDSDLRFVNLPDTYQTVSQQNPETSVAIYSSLAERTRPWLGHIVRTEGAIDTDSRQLHVIAQIDDPYGKETLDRTPLKIGEYVTAEIAGKNLPNAVVIPSSTIYQETYVYIVNQDVIERRDVEILWQSKTEALIGSGLVDGDRLVTTTLGQVASGTQIMIEGEVNTKRDGKRDQSRSSATRPGRKSAEPRSRDGRPSQPEE